VPIEPADVTLYEILYVHRLGYSVSLSWVADELGRHTEFLEGDIELLLLTDRDVVVHFTVRSSSSVLIFATWAIGDLSQ